MSACTVRFYQQNDVEPIHAAALESVADVYPWMAWCHARYTLDEARQWVRLQIEAARQKKAFEFVIVGDDGRLLGGGGVNQVNATNPVANLGYCVRRSAAGRRGWWGARRVIGTRASAGVRSGDRPMLAARICPMRVAAPRPFWIQASSVPHVASSKMPS